MKIAGLDVGSTTVKAVLTDGERVVWRDYQRHNTRQAEKVLEFLERMEADAGLAPAVDRVFVTGSVACALAPTMPALVLARAQVAAGRTDEARSSYDDAFRIWKGADDDVPLLVSARTEYQRLAAVTATQRPR